MDLHETVATRLRRCGQRYTTARRKLIDVFARAGRPLTVDEIAAADRLAPLSTTYRNLSVLAQAGVLHRFPGTDCSRFELAEDLTEHHHHLVCLSCGWVDDFTLSADAEAIVTSALHSAARANGYALTGHRLDAHGLCGRCQQTSG